MKPRIPGTLSATITDIMAKLSQEKCAEILGRSESLIRKWADPDSPALPNLAQALALDRAYVRAGFGEPPIQSWYIDKLGSFVSDDPINTLDIVHFTLHAQSLIGEFASLVSEVTENGASKQNDMSLNKGAKILSLISEISHEFDQFEKSMLAQMDLPDPVCISGALEN